MITNTQTIQRASKLEKFYDGKNIFITGSTGFIGKVFLVKLMHSLSNCGQVYIMLRAKKGISSRERFNKMLLEEPFTPAAGNGCIDGGLQGKQSQSNNFRNQLSAIDWGKIVLVEGDMRCSGLGIEEQMKEQLFNTVNIVFNIAASVKFNAPLKQNLEDNYFGTRNLLELSTKFKKLISFVHVSTFYVNTHLSHVEEIVLPMEKDFEKTAHLIKNTQCSELDKISETLMENRPNSYVYTKAMAENLVYSYQHRLPLCIIRPSITMPSYKDPFPGWIDNFNGPMGAYVLGCLGICRNFEFNYRGVCDLIPVDFVVNSMLAVAERTTRIAKHDLKVYNCSTSSLKPITWGQWLESTRPTVFDAPPYKMLRIPIRVPKHTTRLSLFVGKISELLFAYFVDFILFMLGIKPRLLKLTKKLHRGQELMKHFATTAYTCSNDNLIAAYNELHPDDRSKFCFNPRELNWNEYFIKSYFGTRRLLLREDISNIPKSVRKMKMLMVFEFTIKVVFYSFIAYCLYRISNAHLKQSTMSFLHKLQILFR